MNKPLAFYQVNNNEELHYKKKSVAMKIQLMDETVKTVLADRSLPVSKLIDIIGQKLNIKGAEEYSLQIQGKEGWLKENICLDEQGVNAKQMLLFKKKYFVTDGTVDRDDPFNLHLIYVQVRFENN